LGNIKKYFLKNTFFVAKKMIYDIIVKNLTIKKITMRFYNRKNELKDIKSIINRKESDFIYIY
jgi:hypothetical protein